MPPSAKFTLDSLSGIKFGPKSDAAKPDGAKPDEGGEAQESTDRLLAIIEGLAERITRLEEGHFTADFES